jgi:uncharacterized membrane protein YagU involved in acid resistance
MKAENAERALAIVGGGIAASFAMDVVQNGWAAVFERRRSQDERDEEVDGIASVVRIAGRFVPALNSDRGSNLAARAVHYVFGVAFAAAYVYGARRAAWLSNAGGVAFGSALFLLSDRLLIPALKLGRAWSRYSRSERANAYFSHVAYGVVLEFARRQLVSSLDDAA